MTTKKEKTLEADKLWDEIKDKDLNLFSLPGQTLEKHAKRFEITPDMLHLKLKSAAVLPALEDVLKTVSAPEGKMFDVSQQKDFTVVALVDRV